MSDSSGKIKTWDLTNPTYYDINTGMDMNLEICLYLFNNAHLINAIITLFNLSEAQ